MKYLFLAVSILLSVANACLLRGFANKSKGKPYSAFLFNTGVNATWIVILTISYLLNGNGFSKGALAFGIAYGIILFLFLFFKTQSMAEGPVSLSTLIASCAFVISTWFGVVYANETINVFQIIGMLLLLVSLVLCVNPKKSGEKLSAKWFMYCFGFFIAGGLIGILYKIFGKSPSKNDVDAMLLSASIVSSLLFFIMGIIRDGKNCSVYFNKVSVVFMICCGFASCLYIRMNVSLANLIPSVVFFPVSNGGMVILSTLAGKVFFKEKLNKIQLCGIALGCIAVVITGCGAAVYNLLF